MKFKISLGVIVSVIVIGIIYILSQPEVSLTQSKETVEIGSDISELNVMDYLDGTTSEIENATFDLSEVDTNTVGEYTAYIYCQDQVYNLNIVVEDTQNPSIVLEKEQVEVVVYQELSYLDIVKSIKEDSEYTIGFSETSENNNEMSLKDIISYQNEGDYEIYIVAIDSSGNQSSEKLNVIVENPVKYLNSGYTEIIANNSDFTEYSNEAIPYGVGTAMDENNRPEGCDWYTNKYGNFSVDFIQPESKYVYITFDEGYEYGNTPEILDTLKEKNAKVVFFVTLPFVKSNPELVQRMIDEGHIVGNHTVTHPSAGLCTLSVEDQIYEIQTVHDYMLEHYNYEMYLFRFPTGTFSIQSLAIVQSLGYRSVFWSFAYHDWDTNNQPDVEESLSNALGSLHGGEIFLLHGVSNTDTQMLGDLIDGIREQGYELGYYAKTDF